MTQTEDRASWLNERKSGIGGSDVAAILGLSPWRTEVDVWLDKTGKANDEPPSEAMRIGTELEEYVARRYCEQTGREVRNHNKMIHVGCRLGNIDRLVVPEGAKIAALKGEIRTDTLLECKTSSTDWPDGVPLYYQAQVQHYMGLVPCIEHADVAVLHLVHKAFAVHRIERDKDAIDEMSKICEEWWAKHIVNGEKPSPRSELDCKKLWFRSSAKSVVADDKVEEEVMKLKDVSSRIDDLEKMKKALRDSICSSMGDADELVDQSGNRLVSWKSNKDSTVVDWKSIANEMNPSEELIGKYTSNKPGNRVFRIIKK